MSTQTITAHIAEKRLVAENVFAFRLAVPPEEFRTADAGAHIDVHLHSGLTRQYSLIRVPRDNSYEIAVLREAHGRGGSREFCELFDEGMEISISAPRNNFALEPGQDHYLLIAGGIGITPLLAMADTLWAGDESFAFHVCAALPANVPFLAEIKAAPWSGHVTFHHSAGQPASRLDIKALLGSTQRTTQVYVCGPPPMLDAVTVATQDWPAGRVRMERFSPFELPPQTGLDGAFSLQLRSRETTYWVPPAQSILDILLAEGIECDFSCREGTCGTCVTKVISGDIIHRDSCLYPDEQARGDVIAICISRAQPGTTLVLDL